MNKYRKEKRKIILAIVILLFSWNLIACSENTEDIELTNVDVVSTEELDTESFKQDIIGQDTTNIENKKANINIEEVDKETEEVNKEVNKEVDKKVNKEVEEYIEEFVVTEFQTQRVMYAKSTVNVRTGPSTDYERKGVLQQAEEVIVLGQADTGWMQIAYKDEKLFVSDSYLVAEKPEITITETVSQDIQNAEESLNASGINTIASTGAGIVMIGDSRFVQMHKAVGETGCVWVCENAMGFDWLRDTAIALADPNIGAGTKVVIGLGVNDPGNVHNYAKLVNNTAAGWIARGATVYYLSINPIGDTPYADEINVKTFNDLLPGLLGSNIQYVNTNAILQTTGYTLYDGLH